MTDGFWVTAGITAALSTALATVVSTFAAMWWRWHDRREADWVFFDAHANPAGADAYGDESLLGVHVEVANAGDGIAFAVQAVGRGGCTVVMLGEAQRVSERFPIVRRAGHAIIPVMQPGDRVHLHVHCPDPARWDRAEVGIEWTRSPTWKKRRSRRRLVTPLRDLGGVP